MTSSAAMSYLPRKKFEFWTCDVPRNGSSEVLVHGSDRKHVTWERYYDNYGDARFVARLEIYDDQGGDYKTSAASAVAIASDAVLTSAHSLRGPQKDSKSIHRAARVKVYLGVHVDGGSEPTTVEIRYGTICAVPRQWTKMGWSEIPYDLGIIKLNRPFKLLEPADYREPPPGLLNVHVLGYPGDNSLQVDRQCKHAVCAGCMYEVKGEAFHDVVQKQVVYALSTMPGNSGGPVVLREDPRTVVAIHHGGLLEPAGSGGLPGHASSNVATPVDEGFIEAAMRLFVSLPEPRKTRWCFVTMHWTRGDWEILPGSMSKAVRRSPVTSAMATKETTEGKSSSRHAASPMVTAIPREADGYCGPISHVSEKEPPISLIAVDEKEYYVITTGDLEEPSTDGPDITNSNIWEPDDADGWWQRTRRRFWR